MVTAQEARNWTASGAQDGAKRTYASIKQALEQAGLNRRYSFEVFLQGSYANATNIRGDSDVDVVAMLTSTSIPDLSLLSAAEKARHQSQRSPGTVTLAEFRRDVHEALTNYYGTSRVHGKDKCIRVDGKDSYLDADVVPAYQVRRYTSFPVAGRPEFVEGIQIRPRSGGSIVNYPKEHIRNGASKNGACHERYKATVRQVKRLAVRAIAQSRFTKQDAPGYLLECLVYNVPNHVFVYDDQERLRDVVLHLHVRDADSLRQFLSCDRIHRLFVNDPGEHNEYTAKRVLKELWEVV